MNYKHTQGEWGVNPPFKNDNKVFISNGETVVAYIANNPSINIDDEAEANAKLIASAPKLLEALNTVKSTLTEWDKSNIGRYANLIEYMDSVINNATTV